MHWRINKYLTLIPTNESKSILENYEELWTKIKSLIESITNNLDYYDKKYIKIEFNSDDNLLLTENVRTSKHGNNC